MAFRILSTNPVAEDKQDILAACISTDAKPEADYIATGSKCVEADTGNVYFYNEEGAASEKWVEQFSFKQE